MTSGAEDLARLTFEAAGVGMYGVDRDGTIVVANSAAAELVGRTRDELVGRSAHAALHTSPRSAPDDVDCPMLRVALGAPGTHSDTDVFWRADGRAVPVWWVAAPVDVEGGAEIAMVVVFGDATERQTRTRFAADQLLQAESRRDTAVREADDARRAMDAATAETARLTILASLSDLLNSLDIVAGLDQVAALIVEADLADACVIDRVDATGNVARVALVARGLDVESAAGELHRLPRVTPSSRHSLAQVIGGAEHVVVDLTERGPGRPWPDPLDEAQAELFDLLGASRAVVTGLAARGRVLGALTWVFTADRPAIGVSDLLMARLFALRIGQWMENLRLNDLQQQAALTLQRSLLTDLPQPEHLQIVGRYQPAGEGVEVGGDWYDAVPASAERTVVAIGDVSGHDMTAATQMAQLRSMVRFAALRSPQDPAGVLREVDEAMPVLSVAASASAVLAIVSRTGPDEYELCWSNAGHLPPLLLHGDGSSELLERRPDLLLGVDPSRSRDDHRIGLEPGVTLLLYTDGLVERRQESIDTGLRRLQEVARELAGRDVTGLCDGLLEALASDEAHDDVALLAVRLDPPSGG